MTTPLGIYISSFFHLYIILVNTLDRQVLTD